MTLFHALGLKEEQQQYSVHEVWLCDQPVHHKQNLKSYAGAFADLGAALFQQLHESDDAPFSKEHRFSI